MESNSLLKSSSSSMAPTLTDAARQQAVCRPHKGMPHAELLAWYFWLVPTTLKNAGESLVRGNSQDASMQGYHTPGQVAVHFVAAS